MSEVHRSFDLPDVDSFVAGTVGPAGERAFFLQAVAGAEVITLKVEKQQVIALAQYLAEMMDDLPTPDGASTPPRTELRSPSDPEWAVSSMGVAFVESRDRIALWAEQLQRDGDPETAATGRVQLTRGQVAAFVRDASALVASGRPPCPYCSAPLNDGGTWCSCWN